NKTLSERSAAEQHEATAEAKYRQSEAGVQAEAKADAQGELAQQLAGIHGLRELHIGDVTKQQNATKTKDAQERERVTTTINGIKNQTRKDVGAILTKMDEDAATIFEAGLVRAEKAYEATFEAEKSDIQKWLASWWDGQDHIERSLETARKEYFRQVDLVIDDVANLVDAKLEEAKTRVAAGLKEVEDYVKTLKGKVKGFGDEALNEVKGEFDAMQSEIDQRRDALIDNLTQQYKASYERMSAKEEALREANKSFWERVYDATVGVIKKILAFKDMLVSILKKAAGVVMDILSDPIGFLGNLGSAVKRGLENFRNKLDTHLEKGLMEWLFGALGQAGLKMPEKFDLQGILSIVLQILGLTRENFRARAVVLVGAPVVEMLEQSAKVFEIVRTQGVEGLWEVIKEKILNLKSMVMDAVLNYIKDRVLIAGVTWIISLLNPASAFFKACKAIYDIVKFFIERGSQIMDLVNAVIDSIAAIAKGQLDNATKKVENALAKAIPVAIGFLAALLSLGDISGTIRKFIDRAQDPVNKAIDWVITTAAKGVVKGIAVGKAAVKKLLSWAFASKKFKDAEGNQHTLYVSETGMLTVASAPMAALEFVNWYEKTHNGDAKIAAEARTLIAAAQELVVEIGEKTADQIPPEKQKQLLAANTKVSEKLSQLVGRDPKVAADLEKKYLLEGQVGTYETIPKPVGDKLTPDHQPQASIILAAADFFSAKGIAGQGLAKRAEKRAAQGYAINLHFQRHIAGATYGGKGDKQKDFFDKLVAMAQGKTLEQAKDGVVLLLRAALKKDVDQMKVVAAADITEKPWEQLNKEFPNDPDKAKTLKRDISKRIEKGEEQMEAQPFDF
ncbi:MAG TPA: hypothetical protein VKB93_16840, partial [Thermoanaerobaculia bacterium]|nr:hypothetical protein [Thermoanaerobaculia bacterium]